MLAEVMMGRLDKGTRTLDPGHPCSHCMTQMCSCNLPASVYLTRTLCFSQKCLDLNWCPYSYLDCYSFEQKQVINTVTELLAKYHQISIFHRSLISIGTCLW